MNKTNKSNAQALREAIREEISKILSETPSKTFKAFGGVHSDTQLDAMEDDLKIYKSKDPKVWEKYINGLKKKGYDKSSHKEHPHFKWAMSKYNALK